MNIFFTDSDPEIAAQSLDNLRLNKMILETAQLLSTALREHGYECEDIYKSTHKNHPSAIWTRKTTGNFEWLLDYFASLGSEKIYV